jgi:hypothetical protein
VYEDVKVCDWCDTRLIYNPFTRTHEGTLHLFCSSACLTDHYKFCTEYRDYQSRFNFDVVV